MSSSIRHRGLASLRLAHTSSNLFSKTRLGDEWKAASDLGHKVQMSRVVETPRRQPLYQKPPTPEPPSVSPTPSSGREKPALISGRETSLGSGRELSVGPQR